MRFFLFTLLLLMGYLENLRAQDHTEEAAVKACIQQLFEGMRSGDTSAVRAAFHHDARLQTVIDNAGGNPRIRTATLESFMKAVASAGAGRLDERIRKYKINVDGLLATAWTEYTFYRDGQMHHCGSNAFQLFRADQGWKITQIVDTRYSEGCEEIAPELASEKMTYEFPIPFAPESYVCYRTRSPIKIDGRLEEADWAAASWTNDFVDIEGVLKPNPAHRTRVKMLWDEEYFYFAALLEEPHLWATLHQRDTIIYHDDDFEIFIDPDGDGHHYAEFEMNAHNTVWDMLLLWPYHVHQGPNTIFNWNNPKLKTAVHLEGSLNKPDDVDQYWSVEVAFPWSALRELAPRKAIPEAGDQWRVNFSRVDWHMEIKNGRYVKKLDPDTGRKRPPENWVWSPTGRIDMHRPETWGYVQFSENPVGEQADPFTSDQEEEIKWALWQLFYQQKAFHRKYGWYTADLTHFTLPQPKALPFSPRFNTGLNTFEISAAAPDGKRWYIDQSGRIWKK